MQALAADTFIPVDDYLSGEQLSEVRHEYIAGEVHAMAGASLAHNDIAGSIYSALRSHLKGKRCRPFVGDVKVRLEILGDDVFYYPDVVVGCDPRDTHPLFLRFPTVVVEVLSETTERIDRREKFLSYTRIETLEEYVLVAQDRREVTVFRRANGWQAEVLRDEADALRIASLEFAQPLRDIYEGVKL